MSGSDCVYSVHGDRHRKCVGHHWHLLSSGRHDNRQVLGAVLGDVDARQARRQLNVIDMMPLNVDLVAVTLDFISLVQWTSVAVVSQPDRGTHESLFTQRDAQCLRVDLLSYDALTCAL